MVLKQGWGGMVVGRRSGVLVHAAVGVTGVMMVVGMEVEVEVGGCRRMRVHVWGRGGRAYVQTNEARVNSVVRGSSFLHRKVVKRIVPMPAQGIKLNETIRTKIAPSPRLAGMIGRLHLTTGETHPLQKIAQRCNALTSAKPTGAMEAKNSFDPTLPSSSTHPIWPTKPLGSI